MRRLVALVIVASLEFAGRRAQAAEPTAEDLIAHGLELRRESKPEQALEAFQRAHAAAPSPRTFGQMGLVEASLERWRDADVHLTAALATPNDAWVRKNRAFLAQAIGLVRRHVGELVISGPAGTEVTIDESRVVWLPASQPIKLVEGNAVVTANSAGFKAFSKTVAIAGGAKVALAIVLDPVDKRPAVALSAPAPIPPSVPALPAESDHPSMWKTWTGAGLVAAGAGLLTWGITWIALDGRDQCAIGGPTCATVYDTRTPGWILAAGGAAAAAGGTILLLSGRGGEPAEVTFAATPSSLLLSGRF